MTTLMLSLGMYRLPPDRFCSVVVWVLKFVTMPFTVAAPSRSSEIKSPMENWSVHTYVTPAIKDFMAGWAAKPTTTPTMPAVANKAFVSMPAWCRTTNVKINPTMRLSSDRTPTITVFMRRIWRQSSDVTHVIFRGTMVRFIMASTAAPMARVASTRVERFVTGLVKKR